MTLLYTKEQKALIKLIHDVAEQELKPYVAEADRAGECPAELYEFGFDLGLHLVEVPKEYGGTGLDYETTAMIFEELAKVDAGYAITFVTTFVALRNVILAGTPEQAQYFADVVKRRQFAAFALTEPNAGSDVASLRSTAVETEEGYLLNASKTFITNGGLAQIYIVFCKTDPEAGTHGITAFIVDRNMPGVKVGAEEDKMGLRLSNTTELILDNVIVPKNRVLGKVGEGMKLALNALNLSRAFVCTMGVGIMQRALDEALAYAKERKQFDKPLASFQLVQGLLADMAIKTEASRCLVNNTMRLMDAGSLVQTEGAICKTFVSDSMQEVVSNAIQILGGYGYSREYPVEKLMRDAKVFQVFEGANQIQRITIAKQLVSS
ncbi:MAG: acyl-CoA dehydrogenase family protein [Eggerthellaceae bacterium]